MEDLNDILKLSGMKTKTVKKNLNESVEVEEAYTNEPDETYASVDAILRQGTDLNRPKTQHAVGGFTGDNPMTEGGADVDEDAVRELKIYIDHNADLYKQNVEPIQRNLSRKWDKGIYDHELAQKLFYYLAVNGAKQYGQEHSNGDGLRIFSPDTRRAVAKELADDWLAELKAGNKMDEAEIDLEEMLADILISEDAFDDIRVRNDDAFAGIRKGNDDAFASIRGKKPAVDSIRPPIKKPDYVLDLPGNFNTDNRERQITGQNKGATANTDNRERQITGNNNLGKVPQGALEKILGRQGGSNKLPPGAKPPADFYIDPPDPMPTRPKVPKVPKEITDLLKKKPEYVTNLPVRPGDGAGIKQVPLPVRPGDGAGIKQVPLEETEKAKPMKPDPEKNDAAGYGDETGGPGSDYVNPEFADQMEKDKENKREIERLYNRFPDNRLDELDNLRDKFMRINELMGVQPTVGSGYKSPGASLASQKPAQTAKQAPPNPSNIGFGMQNTGPAPTQTAKQAPPNPSNIGFGMQNTGPKSTPAPTKVAADGQGGYGQGKVTAPPTQTANKFDSRSSGAVAAFNQNKASMSGTGLANAYSVRKPQQSQQVGMFDPKKNYVEGKKK